MPKPWPIAWSAPSLLTLLLGATGAVDVPKDTRLRFEVTVAPGLVEGAADGRVLVALSRDPTGEPRQRVGRYGQDAPPVLGADARGWPVVLDQRSALAPLDHLAQLPAGEYAVQAILVRNRDLNLVDAPGNLSSAVQKVTLDPALGATVKLALTRTVPPEELPVNTANVKYIKLRSELLSKFHGRPMFLRAGLILPRDFAAEPNRRYPLRVHIGGYGSRFTAVGALMDAGSGFHALWRADDTLRMLYLHLDGAGPYGDPYQVNSANNGPYGDAITRELIPYVERTYRGMATGEARFLDGVSTGGWVSLALQTFYPDFFNGAWSRAPDPVDFRALELIDIYSDENAYRNRHRLDRPSSRDLNGDVRTTVRHECRMEGVLGHDGRWELSGKDWCAWNATFGPRGVDGRPSPLWDKNGKIDRAVAEHWKKYDLRRMLEQDWQTLGPKLHGKLHVWVGDADEYFLNNAVHHLGAFLTRARPPYGGTITFGPHEGHAWDALGEKGRMAAMAAALKK